MRAIAWILLLPWPRDIACGGSATMGRLYATLRRCPLSSKQMGRALLRRRAVGHETWPQSPACSVFTSPPAPQTSR